MAGFLPQRSYERSSARFAPWYSVPSEAVVSVEHPGIIKNVEKGIQTLGGYTKAEKLLQDCNPRPVASLSLHPGDRSFKPTFSHNVKTNNVVLKVTVPKRTGLKRRKGSLGPYHESADESQSQLPLITRDTRALVRSLRDNADRYEVQPIGVVTQTHRFRSMFDFVYSTTNNQFMNKMKDNILPFEYPKLKNFKFDMSKGVKPDVELVPPPKWSHLSIPFNYSYRQNPAVKTKVDPLGNVTIINTSAGPRLRNQPVTFDIDVIPTGPVGDLPPFALLEPAMQRLVESAKQLLEERPIWTRRALHNSVSIEDWNIVGVNSAKYLYQYVGYMFGSGPWRDAVVKFGVDPRSDPSFRIYQTMMFMLENEPNDNRLNKLKDSRTRRDRSKAVNASVRDSHMFDGRSVSLDGKVWQVCDITDKLICNMLSNAPVRDKCHIQRDGWYYNGTWAKVKIVMKNKLQMILAGTIPGDHAFLRVVNTFPDIYTSDNRHLGHLAKGEATPLEFKMTSDLRTAATRPPERQKQQVMLLDKNRADGADVGDRDLDESSLPMGSEKDERVLTSVAELEDARHGLIMSGAIKGLPANNDSSEDESSSPISFDSDSDESEGLNEADELQGDDMSEDSDEHDDDAERNSNGLEDIIEHNDV